MSWRVKALARAQQLAKEQGKELNEVRPALACMHQLVVGVVVVAAGLQALPSCKLHCA